MNPAPYRRDDRIAPDFDDEEEMYLREHQSLDEEISRAELEWVTAKFSEHYPEIHGREVDYSSWNSSEDSLY